MNTSTFTTRRTMEEMQNILNDRKAREAAAQRAQELAAREAAETREEQRRIAHEQMLESDQKTFNDLCTTVNVHFEKMEETGKKYISNEAKAAEKQKELNLFVEVADEMFDVEKVDKTKEMQMHNRVKAYKALPFIDFVFALLAIVPIFIHEFHSMVPKAGDAVIIISGIALSLPLGYMLAHLTRLAVAGINEHDNVFKKSVPYLSTLFLPGIYLVGAKIFDTGWLYNAIFGTVSMFIQLFIALQYKNHMEAFTYFKKLDEVNKKLAERERTERTIREEVKSTSEERERLLDVFNDKYNAFTNSFRKVVVEYESYCRKYEDPYNMALGQLTILFGDMQCFQHERIKLQRNADGSIATMPAAVSHEFGTCYTQLAQQVGNSINIINAMLVNANIGMPIPMPEQPTAIAEGQRGQNLIGEDNTTTSEAESSNDSTNDNNNDDIDMPEAWR